MNAGREAYSTLARMAACAAVAAVFALLQVRQSMDQGLLAYPISYDDTTYYRAGLKLLHAVYDGGPLAWVTQWWRTPPHSPWSTVVAALGFAGFGPTDWAPAAVAGGVLVLLFAGLGFALRDLPLRVAVLLAAALLTWPYFGHTVIESRPDMAWGVLVALLVGMTARQVGAPATARGAAGIGALLGLALLAKTSTFPVTLAIAGAALLAYATASRLAGTSPTVLRDAWRQGAIAAAVAGSIALPHYLVAYGSIAHYIEMNVFGDRAHVWELELSRTEHLLYHLTGTGGTAMMGAWVWVAAAVLVAYVSMLARAGDRVRLARCAVYAAAFAIAFAAVTVPAHKSPHIGAVVPAMIALAWVTAAAGIARRLWARPAWRRVVTPLALVMLAFGLTTFAWHSTIRYGPAQSDRYADIRERHGALQQALDAIVSRTAGGRVHVVGSTRYLNAETLGYYAHKARHDALQFDDDLFGNDVAGTLRAVARSEGVVLFTPDNADLVRPLPSVEAAYLEAVGRGVAADPALRRVLALPSRAGAGEALVYLRSPAFVRGVEYRGFGPVEGPYPQWQLPRVRWGFGPRSSLRLPAGNVARRLTLEAQTAQPGQSIEVLVDGRSVARHAFAEMNTPETFVVDLPPAEGGTRRIVEFVYAKWNEATAGDRRPMAVLFRRIQAE